MEEQLSPLAVTHLLQHTLRSLCLHDDTPWVYAVFWRILPRNYPPPKWESHGAFDRSRGNRRNWILVWEDGFCNFAAASSSSSSAAEMNSGDCAGPSVYGNNEFQAYQLGLQPEIFFKMSHEIYNYGEGLIGKVAADHSHKWIHKEPNDQEINFLSTWHNSADSHPRTWDAQFQSGIKTIALIAVREGVVQLGAVKKVIEDLSYVVMLTKKLNYIESIPGVLLPHPSSSSSFSHNNNLNESPESSVAWHNFQVAESFAPQITSHHDHHNNQIYQDQYYNQLPFKITPSMSSLEALLSKLPSVVPPDHHHYHQTRPLEFIDMDQKTTVIAKEEMADDRDHDHNQMDHHVGDSSTSMPAFHSHHQHHQFHHN